MTEKKKVAEKKEINVVASDHFEPESLQKKQLILTMEQELHMDLLIHLL